MKTPMYETLSDEQSAQIRVALDQALTTGPTAVLDSQNVLRRNEELLVQITPNEYPTSMFEFLYALASAEISLRDSGLKVRLIPNVRQRMIVVATLAGQPFAYCSTDGMECADLAELLGIDEKELANTGFFGYSYDSEDDFRLAQEEAKKEFPSVDFSTVKFG